MLAHKEFVQLKILTDDGFAYSGHRFSGRLRVDD